MIQELREVTRRLNRLFKIAPHAMGGIRGAQARAKKLTPKRRSEIGRIAARARWKGTKA